MQNYDEDSDANPELANRDPLLAFMESYTKKVRAYEDKRLQSLKLKDRDEYDAILRDRQKSNAKQQRYRQDQLLLQGTLDRP